MLSQPQKYKRGVEVFRQRPPGENGHRFTGCGGACFFFSITTRWIIGLMCEHGSCWMSSSRSRTNRSTCEMSSAVYPVYCW